MDSNVDLSGATADTPVMHVLTLQLALWSVARLHCCTFWCVWDWPCRLSPRASIPCKLVIFFRVDSKNVEPSLRALCSSTASKPLTPMANHRWGPLLQLPPPTFLPPLAHHRPPSQSWSTLMTGARWYIERIAAQWPIARPPVPPAALP
jgi:hypothetical protein